MEFRNCEYQKKSIKNVNNSSETNVFENCFLKESVVKKVSINKVHILNCTAENDAFSDGDISYGEGIHDNHITACSFMNLRIFNLEIMKNMLTNNTIDNAYFSHDDFCENVVTQMKAQNLISSGVKINKCKINSLELSDFRLQYSDYDNNEYTNTTIRQGRFRDCKFMAERINDTAFISVMFKKCVFEGINFLQASFEQCGFSECKFLNCEMTAEQRKIFGAEE